MSTLNRMHDRCDGCGAEAFVRMDRLLEKDGQPLVQSLLLCGHHAYKHGALMQAQGWTVGVDEREQVNVTPSVSANAD